VATPTPITRRYPIPPSLTFGYEAEYATNAPSLIARLHALGYASTPTLHGYHCDCHECVDSDFHFRGQTDSTCSGEIISGVYGRYGEDRRDYADEFEAFADGAQALATATLDVDAEPGMTAGFHVHVGNEHLAPAERADVVWEFVRWEPVLRKLAGGRWTYQRDGMNTTLRRSIASTFTDYTGRRLTGDSVALAADYAASFGGLSFDQFKLYVLHNHYEADRHSNLCIRTRHHTFEFRLWNSTRSAWRMEMNVRVSLALMDPAVIAAMAKHDASEAELFDLACIFADTDHGRAGELVARQSDYLTERAPAAPSALTIL
jgi:hypothetical protein